jgi:hypothetical protein
MHEKYAKDGLLILPVELDSLEEKDLKEQVGRILRSKKVPVPGLILDAEQEFWQKKLGFDSYPCVFVFDRQGKWTRFRSQDDKKGTMYRDIDALVETLLAKK